MTVYEIIQEFIKKNNYIQDEHVLGILFYGSYQYGLNNPNSDIDLHIVFDDSIPNHLIRGNSFINNVRIEYFEKTISEIYDTIEDEYSTQNNASESIIGNAEIIYEKDNSIGNCIVSIYHRMWSRTRTKNGVHKNRKYEWDKNGLSLWSILPRTRCK